MTPIPAAQQFKAIAYLRWCLFKNAFRRKGGTGELVARIIVYPLFAGFVIGPVLAALTSSYFAISTGHPGAIAPILWAIFALRILVNLNVSQPGLTFDPSPSSATPSTSPDTSSSAASSACSARPPSSAPSPCSALPLAPPSQITRSQSLPFPLPSLSLSPISSSSA